MGAGITKGQPRTRNSETMRLYVLGDKMCVVKSDDSTRKQIGVLENIDVVKKILFLR